MNLIELLTALINKPSITPHDQGCQALIAAYLQPAGFQPTFLRYGAVDNLWITHGSGSPVFVFAGHTDVVPPGSREAWLSDPFVATIRDGFLYGRGAADMKSGLAAMIMAARDFVNRHPHHSGTIALLITSDEEGLAEEGTQKVMAYLQSKDIAIDYCLIGEASSVTQLGDCLKRGRRGSFHATLTIHGEQGHIAYPQRADNPIHRGAPLLQTLVNTTWCEGYEGFPATSFQLSHLSAGTGTADNVIPHQLQARMNFRYSPSVTADGLEQRLRRIIEQHAVRYTLQCRDAGAPFFTPHAQLLKTTVAAIKNITGITPELSTAGGTSDGRFIAPYGAQVIEFGPINASIHKVNEHVKLDDLHDLYRIYYKIVKDLLEEE